MYFVILPLHVHVLPFLEQMLFASRRRLLMWLIDLIDWLIDWCYLLQELGDKQDVRWPWSIWNFADSINWWNVRLALIGFKMFADLGMAVIFNSLAVGMITAGLKGSGLGFVGMIACLGVVWGDFCSGSRTQSAWLGIGAICTLLEVWWNIHYSGNLVEYSLVWKFSGIFTSLEVWWNIH